MPYKDPEKARLSAIERKKRYVKKLHDIKYGPGIGNMKGRGRHSGVTAAPTRKRKSAP